MMITKAQILIFRRYRGNIEAYDRLHLPDEISVLSLCQFERIGFLSWAVDLVNTRSPLITIEFIEILKRRLCTEFADQETIALFLKKRKRWIITSRKQ